MTAPTPRSQKIQDILDSRRPMAEQVRAAEEKLVSAENALRKFRTVIPKFAAKLDGEVAHAILDLDPRANDLLAAIAEEKKQLSLLSSRFSRSTLNIGVAGRAGQGKSCFLQKLSGLTPAEIPSGDKGHCTGAPSVIVHENTGSTYAKIEFHTEASFLDEVIAPFFSRMSWLGVAPQTVAAFRSLDIPATPPPDSKNQTTEEEYLRKLRFFQENLPHYGRHLGSGSLTVKKEEIRSFIAQDDEKGNRTDRDGKAYCTWCAVRVAEIHCPFPHADLGAISLTDTPGIGDFLSGAEERLIEMIGKNLDSVLFVRMPESVRALIKPEDTDLHGLVRRAIPNLDIESWTYFLINKNTSKKGNNTGQIESFCSELASRSIRTKKTFVADCFSTEEVERTFDEFLSDIAANLASLDQKLLSLNEIRLKELAKKLRDFAEAAANALPQQSVVAPDEARLSELFDEVWDSLASRLQDCVEFYKSQRDKNDKDFTETLAVVFDRLREGPELPEESAIKRQAAAPGLQKWQADKMHDLRVMIANSFEEIDKSLTASFERLRAELLDALISEEGGKLCGADTDGQPLSWGVVRSLWENHHHAQTVTHAIDLLLESSLSFRGFIQPRVRQSLDVLDASSEDADNYLFEAGDSISNTVEKLQVAWRKACYGCECAMEGMAKEPSMARFAAAEDFVDALLRHGGENKAKERWRLFYRELRSEIWKADFAKLEADTRLRREWDTIVNDIKNASVNS